jgi:hypothetical protein
MNLCSIVGAHVKETLHRSATDCGNSRQREFPQGRKTGNAMIAISASIYQQFARRVISRIVRGAAKPGLITIEFRFSARPPATNAAPTVG